MMQEKLWRFFTKILSERVGSGEGVTADFPIFPTFSAKNDGVVTLFFGLRNSVTKKLWGKYANFYAVSKAVENWCFSVQAVENHNFSTDSTGFSTTLPPVEKSCGYAVFVDIMFRPFARGLPNFLRYCHFADTPFFDGNFAS